MCVALRQCHNSTCKMSYRIHLLSVYERLNVVIGRRVPIYCDQHYFYPIFFEKVQRNLYCYTLVHFFFGQAISVILISLRWETVYINLYGTRLSIRKLTFFDWINRWKQMVIVKNKEQRRATVEKQAHLPAAIWYKSDRDI